MQWNQRFKFSSKSALIHLIFSIFILSAIWIIIFFIWYPEPYDKLSGISNIFIYLLLIDVVCGPLLTLILFDQRKTKKAWSFDIAIILLIQASALSYGVLITHNARPAFLAYEGDRFRLVSSLDIDTNNTLFKNSDYVNKFLSGPVLIGVKLSNPGDDDYLRSVQLSLKGVYPAFRPERWISYESVKKEVLISSKSLAPFMRPSNPANHLILNFLNNKNLRLSDVSYLPITSDKSQMENWIAIIRKDTGYPLDFLPINGWEE
ncbi:hypothetical protein COAQ111491_16955 [Comamonas aquatilis]|uniref:hypothetical protein n=1 Tax=Comamonas aquatilis TaxID=1778406 RepID=UPI0039EF7D1C